MKRIPKALGLSKEAILYDSKLYIIKATLAIAAGYLIGMAVPIAKFDIISVLLGVMYNLEPINILGVRGGLDQLLASTLGAACTGLLIFFFGINVYTIAIAMSLTLYVSLKINWRMVSPVAIFTCIYMTQCVQLDLAKDPSIWLTFKVRIVALGLGVLIAIVFNYVTSFFYYRKIAFKRLQFAKIQLLSGIEYIETQLEDKNSDIRRDYINVFPNIFNDLDSVYKIIENMLQESKYSINLLKPEKLKTILKILQNFRDINHIIYDINYEICRNEDSLIYSNDILARLRSFRETIGKIDFSFKKTSGKAVVEDIQAKCEIIGTACSREAQTNRIQMNLCLVDEYKLNIIEEAKKL